MEKRYSIKNATLINIDWYYFLQSLALKFFLHIWQYLIQYQFISTKANLLKEAQLVTFLVSTLVLSCTLCLENDTVELCNLFSFPYHIDNRYIKSVSPPTGDGTRSKHPLRQQIFILPFSIHNSITKHILLIRCVCKIAKISPKAQWTESTIFDFHYPPTLRVLMARDT